MKGSFQTVALAALDLSRNVRTAFDAKQDEAFQAHVREHGVMQAICVIATPGTGRFQVLWGHRRARAKLANGDATITAFVMEGAIGPEEITALQISENTQRSPLHAWDLLQAVGKIVSAGWSGARLAKRIGETESTVCRWIAVWRNASPDVLEKIKAGRLSLSAAYKLCRLAPGMQAEAVAGDIATLTRDAVSRKVAEIKRPRKAAQRSRLMRIKIKVADGAALLLSGRGVTLETVVQVAGETFAAATRAQADGLDLPGFIRRLSGQEPLASQAA